MSDTSTHELVRIAVSTSLIHFMAASAIGYTGASIGIFTVEGSIIEFTMLFSSFWGFFGAANVWARNRQNLEFHLIDRLAKSWLGIDDGGQRFVALMSSCFYSPFSMPEQRF